MFRRSVKVSYTIPACGFPRLLVPYATQWYRRDAKKLKTVFEYEVLLLLKVPYVSVPSELQG